MLQSKIEATALYAILSCRMTAERQTLSWRYATIVISFVMHQTLSLNLPAFRTRIRRYYYLFTYGSNTTSIRSICFTNFWVKHKEESVPNSEEKTIHESIESGLFTCALIYIVHYVPERPNNHHCCVYCGTVLIVKESYIEHTCVVSVWLIPLSDNRINLILENPVKT